MTRTLLLLSSFLLLPLPAGAATDGVAIQVTPAVAFAPATVRVKATVDRNDANRAIEVVAESASFYRSSEIQLDGDEAPRTSLFQFKDLPAGDYEVTALLIDAEGQQHAVSKQLRVVGDH
jgi:hypothetical protein